MSKLHFWTFLLLALFINNAWTGLPPTTSKISGDSTNVTTFNYQFPNLTGTHTGITVSIPTYPLPSPSPSGDYLVANGASWIATSVAPPTVLSLCLRYFNTASTLSSSFAKITFSTLDYDTSSAYSSGVFTVPSTYGGKYQVNTQIYVTGVGSQGDNTIAIEKNSTIMSQGMNFSGGATSDYPTIVSDIISLADGDTITIEAKSTAATAIHSSTVFNFVSICRVGN